MTQYQLPKIVGLVAKESHQLARCLKVIMFQVVQVMSYQILTAMRQQLLSKLKKQLIKKVSPLELPQLTLVPTMVKSMQKLLKFPN